MNSLLMLAVLPAAALLFYVYQKDPVEKEPAGLLLRLLGFGVLSTLAAVVLENAGTALYLDNWTGDALGYLLFENFIVVALVEEGCKFFFLYWRTWNDPNFDYAFDGIVYAVFVGLGFAIAENITYVYTYGYSTGVVRAFTAIPGHCVFAVFMGYFYGQAKRMQAKGGIVSRVVLLALAWAVPMLAHGAYDTLASLEGEGSELWFFAFLGVLVLVGWRLVKHQSEAARRVR